MAEETRQSKLALAKRKLKEYWQRNSPGGAAGVKKNRKTNGSVPETATSAGCHSPEDSAMGILGEGPTSFAPLKDLESPSQELAAALDSRSVKISQLKKTIKSLMCIRDSLRKELERVSAELQAHVENHQHVSLLNQGQKERLGSQEERLQQLAEPQRGVEELNNENKSALQSEQQVEELQETLGEVK
ncbi:PREDICTED: golgin subfamily A member 8I-like [Mandrillus leucophaeus]|uniref:golgin subfamily A member 8I-like n=1 Tax=Mandrillus leucophaeus TaxID=9568 RepID=UPI0005F41D3D|nr:PREDICTED: golgin subfamily A member 8I-like [Mandrillus leucophaeus]